MMQIIYILFKYHGKHIGSLLCLREAPVAQPLAANDFVPPPPLQMFSDDLENTQ
jgi:hypothetical protein